MLLHPGNLHGCRDFGWKFLTLLRILGASMENVCFLGRVGVLARVLGASMEKVCLLGRVGVLARILARVFAGGCRSLNHLGRDVVYR